jgi:hypothetical protein
MYYFNHRYNMYLFPFQVLLAWMGIKVIKTHVLKSVLIVLLITAPLSTSGSALSVRAQHAARPEVAWARCKYDLRELVGGNVLYLHRPWTGSGVRRFYAYLLRRPLADIQLFVEEEQFDGQVVITESPRSFFDSEPLHRCGSLSLLRLHR